MGDTVALTMGGSLTRWKVVGIVSDFGTQAAAYVTDTEYAAATGISGTASVLRKKFEQGISESLRKDGISKAAVTCVEQKLRSAISDKQIVALIGAGSKSVPPKIAQATAAAMAACNATT